MRLDGKIAVVTGASSGIGRATAPLFVEEGATVYATDIAPRESMGRLIFVQQDVSSEEAWVTLCQRIEQERGKLDILVNNAGIVGSYATITDVTLDDYHRIIAVNQTGSFLGMRSCIPLMQKGEAARSSTSPAFGDSSARSASPRIKQAKAP